MNYFKIVAIDKNASHQFFRWPRITSLAATLSAGIIIGIAADEPARYAAVDIVLEIKDEAELAATLRARIKETSESKSIEDFTRRLDQQIRVERKLLKDYEYTFSQLQQIGFSYVPPNFTRTETLKVYTISNLPGEVQYLLHQTGFMDEVLVQTQQVIMIKDGKNYENIFNNGKTDGSIDIFSRSLLLRDYHGNNPIKFAKVIIHESHHLGSFNNYPNARSSEASAYDREIAFLQRCLELKLSNAANVENMISESIRKKALYAS